MADQLRDAGGRPFAASESMLGVLGAALTAAQLLGPSFLNGWGVRTLADGVRMCTGRAAPSRIGPTVTPPPLAVLSRLKEMFAASSVGMISRFASPFSREAGNAAKQTAPAKATTTKKAAAAAAGEAAPATKKAATTKAAAKAAAKGDAAEVSRIANEASTKNKRSNDLASQLGAKTCAQD